MRPLPKYTFAKNLNYLDYVADLRNFNAALQNRVTTMLRESIGFVNDIYSVILTGSDGRFEKGIGSSLEFIILHPEHKALPHMVSEIIYSQLNELNGHMDMGDYDDIEIKDIGHHVMSYYKNDSRRVFPMRILDGTQVIGDISILNIAKLRLLEEFTGPEGTNILDKIKSKKREYKKVSLEGTQRFNKDMTITHFDMDEGLCFYDPDENQYSFKIGQLRFVQFALMQDIMAYTRRVNQDRGLTLLVRMPTNTEEKISYLYSEGFLNLTQKKADDLTDCYNYFLWAYNNTQDKYRLRRETTSVFDKKEVTERTKLLLSILDKPIIR
jgi:hypothetical protein